MKRALSSENYSDKRHKSEYVNIENNIYSQLNQHLIDLNMRNAELNAEIHALKYRINQLEDANYNLTHMLENNVVDRSKFYDYCS